MIFKNLNQAQAEACHNLGAIYNSQGRFDRAVEFFEKNFRLCRQLVKDCGAKTNVVDKVSSSDSLTYILLCFSVLWHVALLIV